MIFIIIGDHLCTSTKYGSFVSSRRSDINRIFRGSIRRLVLGIHSERPVQKSSKCLPSGHCRSGKMETRTDGESVLSQQLQALGSVKKQVGFRNNRLCRVSVKVPWAVPCICGRT
jgi:hypothetical protein